MHEWINARHSARVPDDDRYVLVCTATKKGQMNIKIGYWNGERWCVGMNDNVIAWMDLPDLPEEEGALSP